mmetsp:Transcript_6335/g.26588  ORF Transcript_6335/g.26588 Transcript_6335/m.26588 type:complete len:322 (+) Transcript_6335:3193-4158(+)
MALLREGRSAHRDDVSAGHHWRRRMVAQVEAAEAYERPTVADVADLAKRPETRGRRAAPRGLFDADSDDEHDGGDDAANRGQPKSARSLFRWREPDEPALEAWCRDVLGWTDDKIEDQLGRTLVKHKERLSRPRVQRIDAIYDSYHSNVRFAEVTSKRLRRALDLPARADDDDDDGAGEPPSKKKSKPRAAKPASKKPPKPKAAGSKKKTATPAARRPTTPTRDDDAMHDDDDSDDSVTRLLADDDAPDDGATPTTPAVRARTTAVRSAAETAQRRLRRVIVEEDDDEEDVVEVEDRPSGAAEGPPPTMASSEPMLPAGSS